MCNGQDVGKKATEWRTSRQAWLDSHLTPTIAAMTDRVANLVCCPASQQESLQVLSYGLRQKYDVHLDAFDPKFYQQKPGERSCRSVPSHENFDFRWAISGLTERCGPARRPFRLPGADRPGAPEPISHGTASAIRRRFCFLHLF